MKVRLHCFWSSTVILGSYEDVVEGVYQMPTFEIEMQREVEEHEVEEHEVKEDSRVFQWRHVRLFANKISFQPDAHLLYPRLVMVLWATTGFGMRMNRMLMMQMTWTAS